MFYDDIERVTTMQKRAGNFGIPLLTRLANGNVVIVSEKPVLVWHTLCCKLGEAKASIRSCGYWDR